MIDPTRILSEGFVIEHQHGDGSWSRFERQPAHPDAAEHDPERDWERGEVFRCPTCDEQIRVRIADDQTLDPS